MNTSFCTSPELLRHFEPLLLEDVVSAVQARAPGSWIDAFSDRYLAYEKLDQFESADS